MTAPLAIDAPVLVVGARYADVVRWAQDAGLRRDEIRWISSDVAARGLGGCHWFKDVGAAGAWGRDRERYDQVRRLFERRVHLGSMVLLPVPDGRLR